jgi:hypothetical protein
MMDPRRLALFALAALGASMLLRRRGGAARHAIPSKEALDDPAVHAEDLHSYQVLLDESLALTFPASDPICATAATRCGDRTETAADGIDWRLEPGSAAATERVR